MRKIIFHLSTGYAGMDETENGVFPDDITSEELDDEAWLRAVDHAESYGIYPYSDIADYSEEEMAEIEEDGCDNYSDNIDGWWEDYDPEKHDMLKPGGGKWGWE